MTFAATFKDLALETLQTPRVAAERVMAMNLPRETLWMALVLMALLNTLIGAVTQMVAPPTENSPIPAMMMTPMIYFVIVAGGLVLTVYALFWAGRALGGEAELGDMLSVLVWLQALRVCAQGIALVLLLVSPALAGLFVLSIGIIGLWILINFIQAAHRFPSPWQAAGVLLSAMVGLVLGLSLLLSLIGVSAMTGA